MTDDSMVGNSSMNLFVEATKKKIHKVMHNAAYEPIVLNTKVSIKKILQCKDITPL